MLLEGHLPSEHPLILVLVVHWNNPVACLNVVKQFLETGLSLKVKIIDNNSTKKNKKLLKQTVASLPVNFVELEANYGWGKALNIFLKKWINADKYKYCIISAHDPIFESKQCIKRLIEVMENEPLIGMASPVYLRSPSLTTYSPIRGVGVRTVEKRKKCFVEVCPIIHQTITIFRKECLKDIGLYDERFFAYGEEYDLPLRAYKYGWKPSLVWNAIISNPECSSTGKFVSYLLARNSLLLARIHGNFISASFRAILIIGNSILLYFLNRRQKCQIARIRGVLDFFRGKFGKPLIHS